MKEAKRFPLVASAFLFGIYCLYKVLPKHIFMGLVNAYFSISIVFSISGIASEVLSFSE
jgi:ABC-type molybdate transport system permease subunit